LVLDPEKCSKTSDSQQADCVLAINTLNEYLDKLSSFYMFFIPKFQKHLFIDISSMRILINKRFYGVTVSTLDFESSNPSSNLGRTF
jgi:hypothetical protein